MPAGLGGRAEHQRQVIQSLQVIFAPAAHIADPGGKIGHGNHLLAQPGEVGDVRFAHLADAAAGTRDHAQGVIVVFQIIKKFLIDLLNYTIAH